MPRRAPSYNPMALRIWRMLKRMGITSPRGIFLSLVFWSLFICLTYFIYTESTRFLDKIEAKKFDITKLSKLGPRSMVGNGTLLARNFRRFDALGLFKTYLNNNSTVEDLLNVIWCVRLFPGKDTWITETCDNDGDAKINVDGGSAIEAGTSMATLLAPTESPTLPYESPNFPDKIKKSVQDTFF